MSVDTNATVTPATGFEIAPIRRRVTDSEEILAQAGFQREPLHGTGLPARQLVQTTAGYSFSDPEFCKCAYVGAEREYAELQRLRAARKADRNWALQHGGYGNTGSPIVTGAWDPEGLDVIKAPIAAK
jgi:hypothetical protein